MQGEATAARRAGALLWPLTRPVLAILIALLLGAVLVALLGDDPLEVYGLLITGSLQGWNNIAVTLQMTTPLIFTGLAVSFAFRSGLWNIGVEGQMLTGALAAGIVGYAVPLPAFLHIPLCLAAAAVAGAAWAAIPGLLRAYLEVNELVVCLMLNPVALLLTGWVSARVLKAPGPTNKLPDILPSAVLPGLSAYSQLNDGIFIGGLLVVAVWLFNRFTLRGFEWKMMGLNPRFAFYCGIRVRGNAVGIFLVSGAIAGLAGAEEVMGVYHAYFDNFSPGYGFDGIAVAMLAGFHPVGVVASALLFGALDSGSVVLQMMTGISKYLIQVLQFTIVLLLAARFGWQRRPGRVRGRQAAAAPAAEAPRRVT
jgi:ABC-type uncharacterized transport system permease subunit